MKSLTPLTNKYTVSIPPTDENGRRMNTEWVAADVAKQLEEQLAIARDCLVTLRDNPKLWKAGGAGGQDQYAGQPPGMRLVDAAIAASEAGIFKP